jgi:hypothetical protein
MVAGALGLVLSPLFWSSFSPSALPMVDGDTVVQERTIRRDRSCWIRSYNLK